MLSHQKLPPGHGSPNSAVRCALLPLQKLVTCVGSAHGLVPICVLQPGPTLVCSLAVVTGRYQHAETNRRCGTYRRDGLHSHRRRGSHRVLRRGCECRWHALLKYQPLRCSLDFRDRRVFIVVEPGHEISAARQYLAEIQIALGGHFAQRHGGRFMQ